MSKKFEKNTFWHICNKSIANYGIFKDSYNAKRFEQVLDYYNTVEFVQNFGKAICSKSLLLQGMMYFSKKRVFKCISYCIMPDHYHLLIKVSDDSISQYISKVQNSFTRFFNIKYRRKGPLWQSRFRTIQITTNSQLLHTSRYIHLNPVTDYLVNKAEDWLFSSYSFYIKKLALETKLKEISIKSPILYQKFIEDQIDYQRKLKYIKKYKLE